MSEQDLIEHETYLMERIDELRRQYEQASKPYVDRLVYLRGIRPLPAFQIDASMLPPEVLAKLQEVPR